MVEKELKRISIKVAEKFKEYYEVSFEKIEESQGKRILDIFIPAISLTILSTFLLIISLLILSEDRLPIVFKQERVGINEKPFIIHKFGSIKKENKSKAKFASVEQHRILKIGKIMRIKRLDETLQFIDIFRVAMPFFGLRLEQVNFVKEYNDIIPFYNYRLKLKPGLTGWAQIMYKYSASIEEVKTKLSYDLYYVKNRDIFLDLNIIIKTIEAVFWKRGAV